VQIILVDRRLRQARAVTVSPRMLMAAGIALVVSVLLAVIGLYVLTFRAGTEFRLPLIQDLVTSAAREESARHEQVMRDNVAAMARKVGEMQAQLMRLDALGERVSQMSGIRPETFNFREPPGRGGAAEGARAMSLQELESELQRIAHGMEARSDYMNVIESELVDVQVRRALLPQNTPVSEGFIGSGFGMRTDPFTGQVAMHAGIDFAAPVGTPIFAAAGGVVTSAEFHPIYGRTVVIDHGNDLSTLYAHASRMDVKPGDIVRRGQKIAEVGSTGRSTGPHLHFEVHSKGVPQNPTRFLAQSGSPFAALATAAPRKSGRAVDVQGLARAAGASR
jgi:murein DD-endopeptidase MepM/ murein hydrolase activator NlpD